MTASVDGALRVAATTLWSSGGFAVALRLPVPASGNDAEQLGLSSPVFQDLPVGPAVWHKAGECDALLLAAEGVASLMSSQAITSSQSLFESAAGVVVDAVLYEISDCAPISVGGAACAYRLTVQGPAWS